MKTEEEVLEEFKKVHGDRYNYSKVQYNGAQSKVTIICPEHGEFTQLPSSHKNRNGCKKCATKEHAENRKFDINLVLEEFKKVHGDRYDYSKVEYINGVSKVTIICPEHGEFEQSASSHKSGSGCPKCFGKGATTQEIIKKFRKVHGDRYDYSKVEYIDSVSKVTIICPEHGEFEQSASSHKSGAGCKKCATQELAKNRKFDINLVLEEFKKIHGDRYDYSKVEYVNGVSKVTIICPKHGEFTQTPSGHKNGSGCKKCATQELAKNRKFDINLVLEEFKKVHGDRYDYSKVEYIDSASKITIICPEHGEFIQSASSHKSGAGCPKCLGRGLTSEEIIEEFKKVHGNKYDYSKVQYNGASKVTIICPEHGEFTQTPSGHKNGSGCSACVGNTKLTSEEIIEEFKKVHGNKYDYSKVQYNGAHSKVTIICPKHGEFTQSASNHKNGTACQNCATLERAENRKHDVKDVIDKFREIHGDRYDYSKVEYISSVSKVTIICPEHGEFTQSAISHKSGSGCPKCFGRGLTSEEIIEEFKKVHGNKYDYSKVQYNGIYSKVTILCSLHGEFIQTPNNHKRGNGCPKCFGRALTTEEVLEEFRKVHGDRYDYSKVQYNGIYSKVTIICPKHGEFTQIPYNHNIMGCPDCVAKLTTEEVLEEFRKVHGDRYDYSKVQYNGINSEITIICTKHGEFIQTPNNHKRGNGCPKCFGRALTTEEVLEEFKKIHGNKYDYSKVQYIDSASKVTIICPEHGEFTQIPSKYKSGSGCPDCIGNVKLTTEEIIEEFKKIHGNKYDYSKVEYIDSASKVTIICPEHGEFTQTPSKHKNGSGCSACVSKIKLTSEEIIEEFRKVHGNKYDYSKVQYINNTSKVIVICPKHGEFTQTPSKHKNGKGCPKCFGRGLTSEEIIEEFKKVHNNKYNYSKVQYINSASKITIICPKHGEFTQTPSKHKSGSGCPDCIGNVKLTTEEIIEEFRKVHGNKYDYSQVQYINIKTPITIICPEHGEFTQIPDVHKRGGGCKKCANQELAKNRKFDINLVLEEFKKVHGDRYDYSKVEYINIDSKVTIICPEHGEFTQIPYNHKMGMGCPKCLGRNLTAEEVIDEFRKVHGDRYDYSKIEYVNSASKITIICPEHGEFIQSASNHKIGMGCPTCNRGWSKQKIIEFVNSIDNNSLLHMDSIELQMIISQGILPNIFNELVFDESDNRDNTIKSLKYRLESELKNGNLNYTSSLDNNILNEFNNDEVEITDIFPDVKSTVKANKESNKKNLIYLSNNTDDLHVLDNELLSSCDNEAVEFLIQYKLRKLWNLVLNKEFDIENFKNEQGGKNFILLKNYFFKEYNDLLKYTPPNGYNFHYQPNMMQKLTVFRLLKHKRYGNWSGTGAGKTLSFILSSREIGAKITILVCLNSTIEQLRESIEEIFPDSKTFTYYNKGYKFNRNYNNYLILNFDKFQQGYSEELFQDLTNNNIIDFIAIDEIHNVKQRNLEEESIRRGTLKRLIGRASESNENLYVLGMSATPVINNLTEAKSLLEMITGKEYSDFSTKRTLTNALEAFKHLTINGLRYIPKYDIQIKELTAENTTELKIEGKDLLDELLKISNNNYLKAEQLILEEKLKSIKIFLGKGVLVYSYFTTGMINKIESYIKSCGYTVGTFTGDEHNNVREDNKNKFLKGEIDILIGSKPVGTGVDGLQKICNRMIVLSLPWTDSEYTQLKGRIYRQGSNFGEVDIIIPQVFIQLEDIEWSWDIQRWNLIRHKKTLADAAIDGLIPSKRIPSPETLFKKSQEALREWKNRINEGKIFKIDRKDLTFPLNPEIIKQLGRMLGEFSEINKNWSIASSKTTHEHLKNNPEDWYYYHTLYSERRKTWDEIPYVEIGKMITRKGFVVADLGCGEDLLRHEIPDNKVLSFDHVAINENVTASDISDLPLEGESIDITVFSLSLMGTNFKDYLKEAFRILRSMGVIIIAEPITKWDKKEDELENILTEIGFNKANIKRTSQFIYVTSIKFKI